MKVLHVAECAGGVEKYLEMITPLLKKRGVYQCLVCSDNYDIEKFFDSVDYIVQSHTIGQTFNPFRIAKIIIEVKREIRKERPDIVYCHSSFAGFFGRIAALGSKSKVVYNPHGWSFNIVGKKFGFLYLFLERFFSRFTNKIICISNAELSSALNKKVCNKEKLLLIENGIDVKCVRNAVSKTRRELGISDDAFVVGMIGRLSKQKAPDIFIKGAKIIHDRIPNSAFIIVGDGEEYDEIKQYAEVNGLNLIVTGWTTEAYSYLKIFDVAMLLSRWEGFGLAIIEYMAAEKNVIATRVDAIPTLVDDGVDGLLVDVDSPEQASDAVFWLNEHPYEASLMRKNALKKVLEKYYIQRVADQHIEMFKNLSE